VCFHAEQSAAAGEVGDPADLVGVEACGTPAFSANVAAVTRWREPTATICWP
jgi:hypothetical protein